MTTPTSPDAATWGATAADPPELTFGRGRSPRMTYLPWHQSQTTELGGNQDGWYRRCLTRGCRVWAGPYQNGLDVKTDGMDHQYHAHDHRCG